MTYIYPNRHRFVYAGLYLMICILTVVGTEALFADLAHFPLSAIQLAFTVVVFPCLLLAYAGQAAYLIKNQEHFMDAFYRSIPGLFCTLCYIQCPIFFIFFHSKQKFCFV